MWFHALQCMICVIYCASFIILDLICRECTSPISIQGFSTFLVLFISICTWGSSDGSSPLGQCLFLLKRLWHLILQGKFCEISHRFVDTIYAHSWICCDQVHDLWFSLKLSLLDPTTWMDSILALIVNESSSQMVNNFWAICDSLKRLRGASQYVANSHGNQALEIS